jgi:hypothetical protein
MAEKAIFILARPLKVAGDAFGLMEPHNAKVAAGQCAGSVRNGEAGMPAPL